MAAAADLTIVDLSGGMNDNDPPSAVPQDQCVSAVNVEFVRSNLGERRAGASAVTVDATLSAKTHMGFLGRYLPSADETAAELIAFAVTPATAGVLMRKDSTWHAITQNDTIGVAGIQGFQLSGVSFHGKYFLAHKSTVDRLHVWDGTTLRRVGLKTPAAAPTGANTGAGTFSGVRYYRVRFTIQSGGVTILRSEPSAVLTFTPSGAGTGVIVTRPATISENETHWELEASLNNSDFYRIATTVLATTTSTDSTALTTGYAAAGTLSEDVGDYTVPISCKYVAVDNDRLVMAGSWETAAYGSRVSWTTVTSEPGVGNDERVPIDTDNILDVDATEGGDFTGLSQSVDGSLYLTKFSHIYRMVRTGERSRAYDIFPLSKVRGAIEGSLVTAVDQSGAPCVYGLDPHTGPWRVNSAGLRTCSRDIAGGSDATWARANLNATSIVTRALYYPNKKQVIWWVAVDGGNTPSLKIVLQTDKTRDGDEGVRRGFSTATGPSAAALCATLFASNIESNTTRNLTLVPLIGTGGSAAGILMLDTGTTDNGTVYYASVTTRPYLMAGILNKFGAMASAFLAKAATGITLYAKAIRDFGVDTKTVTTSLTPVGSEEHVIKVLDDFSMSEMHAFQLQYGDDPTEVATPAGTWEVNQFAMKPRAEETA